MTDSWGRPELPDQRGAGPFPGPTGRIGSRQVSHTRGPLFEDEWEVPTEGPGHGSVPAQARDGRRPQPATTGGATGDSTGDAWAGSTGLSATGGRAERRRGGAAGGPGGGSARGGRPAAVSSSVLIGLPLLAALASGGQGLLFGLGAVAGAVGAATLCSRPGVWWVSTGTPPVVLLMALLGLVVGGDASNTGKFATNLAKGVAGAFPVMGAALGCAVLVGVVRVVLARRERNGSGRG